MVAILTLTLIYYILLVTLFVLFQIFLRRKASFAYVTNEMIDFKVLRTLFFTFQNILDMNLFKFTDEICEIGERAGKEYNIETSMAKMKGEWKNIR